MQAKITLINKEIIAQKDKTMSLFNGILEISQNSFKNIEGLKKWIEDKRFEQEYILLGNDFIEEILNLYLDPKNLHIWPNEFDSLVINLSNLIAHAENQDKDELGKFKKMIVIGISQIITSLNIETFANTINALNNELKANISNDLAICQKIVDGFLEQIKSVDDTSKLDSLISILGTFLDKNNVQIENIDFQSIKKAIYYKISDFNVLANRENSVSEVFKQLKIFKSTDENIPVDLFKEITKKILNPALSDYNFYHSIKHLSVIIVNISPNLKQEIEADLNQIKNILSTKVVPVYDFTLMKCFLNLGFNDKDNFFDQFINDLSESIEGLSLERLVYFIKTLEAFLIPNDDFKLKSSLLKMVENLFNNHFRPSIFFSVTEAKIAKISPFSKFPTPSNLKIEFNLVDKIIDYLSGYSKEKPIASFCITDRLFELSKSLDFEKDRLHILINALIKLTGISNKKISDESLERIIRGSFEIIGYDRIALEGINFRRFHNGKPNFNKRFSDFNSAYIYHILKILSSLVEENSKINEGSENHSFIQDANNWQNLSKIIDGNIIDGNIKISYQFGYFINSILLKNHNNLMVAQEMIGSGSSASFQFNTPNELQNLIDRLNLAIDRGPNSFETRFQILLYKSEVLNYTGRSKLSLDEFLKYQADIIKDVDSFRPRFLLYKSECLNDSRWLSKISFDEFLNFTEDIERVLSNKTIFALWGIEIAYSNEKVMLIHCSDDSVYISRNHNFAESTLIKFETTHNLLSDYKQLLNFFLENGDNSEKLFNQNEEIDSLDMQALKSSEEINRIIKKDAAIHSILEKYIENPDIIENFDLPTLKSVLSLMLFNINTELNRELDVVFCQIEHSVNTNLNNASQEALFNQAMELE